MDELLEAARAALQAYDAARAVCCPRCEMEPEGAVWVNSSTSLNEETLEEAMSRLRSLLEV